jgi:hypothetical protein
VYGRSLSTADPVKSSGFIFGFGDGFADEDPADDDADGGVDVAAFTVFECALVARANVRTCKPAKPCIRCILYRAMAAITRLRTEKVIDIGYT